MDKLDRTVALKLLLRKFSDFEENKIRFMKEVKAVAALSQSNILNIYEVVEQDGEMCLVMELVSGDTLKSYITNLNTGLGDKENYEQMLRLGLEVLPRYLSRHPDDARSRIYYATELAEMNRVEEAKTEAKKALDLSPGDPRMLYNAACCYARLGDKKIAVDTLRASMIAGLEDYEWIKTDPDFDNIREEAGYREIMKGK